jgi:hypothetical protein
MHQKENLHYFNIDYLIENYLVDDKEFLSEIDAKYDFIHDKKSIKNRIMNLSFIFVSHGSLEENEGEIQNWIKALKRRRTHEENIRVLFQSEFAKDPEKKDMITATNFLVYFESCYIAVVDQICELLVAEGHDLLDFNKRKYAKSLEEISNVDTSVKCGFLHEHGFSMLVRDDDRILRNKIAHLQYTIENSQFKINGKVIDIGLRYRNLFNFVESFNTDLTTALQAMWEITNKAKQTKCKI